MENKTQDELADFCSLCIISEARTDFFAAMLKWASDWAEENDYAECVVRNTQKGQYEIMARYKSDEEEQQTNQPTMKKLLLALFAIGCGTTTTLVGPTVYKHDTTTITHTVYVDSVRLDTVSIRDTVTIAKHDTTVQIVNANTLLPFVVLFPQPGDNWLLLQTAIDNYIDHKDGWPLLMPGTYKISRPLLAARTAPTSYGKDYIQVSLRMEGTVPAKNTPAAYTAHIQPTYPDVFTLGIQKGKGCVIANIAFDGPQTQYSGLNALQIDTLPWSWWTAGFSRTDPESGLVIDPFSQSDAYDSTHRMYKGFEAYYLPQMSRGGSTGISITGCSFINHTVGVMITPSYTANAEEIDVTDCAASGCASAYAFSQAQSKTNTVNRFQVWGGGHTIWDGGHWGFSHGDGSIFPMVSVANIAGYNHEIVFGSANSFSAMLDKVYAEGIFKVGNLGGNAGVTFTGCQINFQVCDPGMPQPDTYFEGQSVSWNNCMLRVYNDGKPISRIPWGGQDNYFTGGSFSGPMINIASSRLRYNGVTDFYVGPNVLDGTGGWDTTFLASKNATVYCDHSNFTGHVLGLSGVKIADMLFTSRNNDEGGNLNPQYPVGVVVDLRGDSAIVEHMGYLPNGTFPVWANRLKS